MTDTAGTTTPTRPEPTEEPTEEATGFGARLQSAMRRHGGA